MYVPAPMIAAVIFVLAFLVARPGRGRRSPSAGGARRALPAQRADARGPPLRGDRASRSWSSLLGVAVPLADRRGQQQRPRRERAGRRGPQRRRDEPGGRCSPRTARPATRSRRPTPSAGRAEPRRAAPAEGRSSSTRSPTAARAAGPDARRARRRRGRAGRRRVRRRRRRPRIARPVASRPRRVVASALVAAATWAENRPVGAGDPLVECAAVKTAEFLISNRAEARERVGKRGTRKLGRIASSDA